jgi:hypothetical protein
MSRYAKAWWVTEEMTQRDNILQELNELNSQLAGRHPENIFTVPAGYFEELTAKVLNRIRALEAVNAADELAHLSPVLSKLSKQMPYTVPGGYFEELTESVMQSVSGSSESISASEETAALSPLLGSLKKEMPYQVPQGYFDNLSAGMASKEDRPAAKVVSLSSRKWFSYAAAAVVTGAIVIAGFFLLNNSGETKEGGKVFAKVTKDVKKLSDMQKDDLIDFLNAGMSGTETAQVNSDNKSKEIQQLLQDVSEAELKDFQEQTEDLEDVLMIN